jgi:hypothetical protein
MTTAQRSLLLLVFFVLVFLFSYWGYTTIDDSYLLNEPQHVIDLEAANDSLATVAEDLQEELDDLQEKVDDLVGDSEAAPVDSAEVAIEPDAEVADE